MFIAYSNLSFKICNFFIDSFNLFFLLFKLNLVVKAVLTAVTDYIIEITIAGIPIGVITQMTVAVDTDIIDNEP